MTDQLQHPCRNTARDVLPAHLRAFTLACLNHLMQDHRLPMAALVRHQYPLMQRLTLRMDELREAAGRSAFRQLVLDGAWHVEARPQFAFRFDLQAYPVPGNKRSGGKFRIVGKLWAQCSSGRAAFAMLFEQIDAALFACPAP